MKRFPLWPLLSAAALAILSSPIFGAVSPEKAAATVILNETGVKNLQIQTVEAEETDFEQTVFALGRIQSIPEKRAVVASRIPGRINEIRTVLGTMIEAGADVLRIESRQPGNPPPSIWLKAPAGGLVSTSEVRLGEPVEPDRALLEITDLSEVYAVAQLPEHLAGKIRIGAVAHIHVSALPEETFEGTLLRFGTAADKSTGTIDAIFALPNSGLRLRPNLRAEFSIVLSKREQVMSIPKVALQGDALNRFVYVKDYDLPHAFVKSPIQVGRRLGRAERGDHVVPVSTAEFDVDFRPKKFRCCATSRWRWLAGWFSLILNSTTSALRPSWVLSPWPELRPETASCSSRITCI